MTERSASVTPGAPPTAAAIQAFRNAGRHWHGSPGVYRPRSRAGAWQRRAGAARCALNDVPLAPDPAFGIAVPRVCPNVPAEVLNPRSTWADPAAYDAQARKLAAMFAENFKVYADQVAPEVRAAGLQPARSAV
jgi:ATP-dependent phosphoenolpyruvate carboxykinase